MTVTVQVVGMETAVKRGKVKYERGSSAKNVYPLPKQKVYQIKCLQAPNDTLQGTRVGNGTFQKGEALLNPVFYMAFLECPDCP